MVVLISHGRQQVDWMVGQPHGCGPSRAAPLEPQSSPRSDDGCFSPSGQIGTNNVLKPGHKIKSDRYSEGLDLPLHSSIEQQSQGFFPGLQPVRSSVNTPAVVSSRLQHLISWPRKGEPKTNASPKPNRRRRIAAVELNHSQRSCILRELAISCVDIRSKYPNLRDWLVPLYYHRRQG